MNDHHAEKRAISTASLGKSPRYAWNSESLFWSFYEQLDLSRRWQGSMLDAMGLGPIETPSRIVFSEPGVTLRAYGDGISDTAPVLLMVPAPIKRPYIWDLIPAASVVQRCVSNGVRVYMIHWGQPGPEEELFGLNEYADRLILNCLEVIEAELGQSQLFLAGHSLGGTLTAIFASLYPDRLRGLVLIAAPLHFGSTVGIFGPLAAAIDHVRHTARLPARVPGSFLSLLSLMASPSTFGGGRWLDWIKSLPDPQALRNHLRVERWTLDEMPMPRRLFEEVVKLLIREDRLLRGTLTVRGRRAAPELIRAPLLCIADARCRIVPPEAILPFHEAIGSADKRLLWYEGDKGVSLQHVGPLVGQTAHQQLWPEILRWIQTHSQKP